MDRPIGVFDSGVGGISVLRELYALMGNENFIYFGDSVNAPYGEKTKEEVRALSFEVAKKLMDMGVKALVIACNTATSAAAKELREKYGDKLSIIGLEPALKPAVMENKGKTIAVMATPLTLREEKFLGLLASYENDAKIIPLEAPGLAEMIEKGILEGEKIETYLKELFADLPKIDALVLGCTHYPLIKDTIKKMLPDVCLFDGGAGASRYLKKCLLEKGLLKENDEKGKITFLNSLSDEMAKWEEEIFLKGQI